MDTTEQRDNTHIAERVDAQTQTETSTAEDLTLSQKLTALTHHELQLESAAQLAPPPPPPSSTTTTKIPLDKFDKDILRWKDVYFLRDFGDWFDPEKAVQPTYTRLLSSCGYYDPNSPLDLVEGHGNSPPLGVDHGESSDTGIPNQNGRGLISPDTDVERDVRQCFVPESKSEDTTVVGHTDTPTASLTDTISTGSTQTASSSTITVGPSLDDASAGDDPNPNPDPDLTVLVELSMN